ENQKSGTSARWTGEVVEMDGRFADEAEQQENLRSFLDELDRRDFSAAETELSPPLPASVPKDYRLVGNARCVRCHKDDCASWEASRHARAWETLTTSRQHVDPFCQLCHTNGFGLPGGFESRARTPKLADVGCEACHGPSAGHARNSSVTPA